MNPRPLDTELLKPEAYPRLTLDEGAWAWFLAACADLEIPVTAEHRRVMEALYSHLLGVNAWLNLTRLTSAADYLKFHVFDSLTALAPVEELTGPGDLCLDLGSGGGLPRPAADDLAAGPALGPGGQSRQEGGLSGGGGAAHPLPPGRGDRVPGAGSEPGPA